MPEAGNVHLHPGGPLATVTAVYKVCALQQKGSTCDHGCFLRREKVNFRVNSSVFCWCFSYLFSFMGI